MSHDPYIDKLMSFTTPHKPRAYVNTLVRFHHPFTAKDRLKAAQEAGWNVFQFPSEMLTGGDLLSDSGTTTLTSEQFAAMIIGDEAYGTNYGYPKLLETFEKTFGIPIQEYEVYLFHQGRPAEYALFSCLSMVLQKEKNKKEQCVIPSNGHFDTTAANIEAQGIRAVNIFETDKKNTCEAFGGNMNISLLKDLLEQKNTNVPLVYTTITNNTAGGQPVSLKNLHEIRKLCDANKKPFFLDACRFAENAWFIKQKEKKYQHMQIQEIVREMFSLCDGFTISLKKDGLSNIGGALIIKKDSILSKKYPEILNMIRDHQILTEGHPTYGGITGRDIMVLIEGLKTVVREDYLSYRTGLVRSFGDYLAHLGIPVLKPFGGHAVYIDIDRFFKGTKMRRENFGGISLTALLLLKGVRLCELGAFAFGKYDPKTEKETFPKNNFVRCAVPRNKYEQEDLFYVADCIKGLYDKRDMLPKAIPVFGRDLTLRHFKAKFELVPL